MARRRVASSVRKAVARHAGGCYEYCRSQEQYSPDTFSIEHIRPASRGGRATTGNLALSCQGCNNRNFTAIDAEDPVSGEVVPLFHPRKQIWSDHFAWNEDFSLIVALTATGRATVARLGLNRDGVVSLRRLLLIDGKHPPLGTDG